MIKHPFPPLYDKDSKIVVLGSFPSVNRANNCSFTDITKTDSGK